MDTKVEHPAAASVARFQHAARAALNDALNTPADGLTLGQAAHSAARITLALRVLDEELQTESVVITFGK